MKLMIIENDKDFSEYLKTFLELYYHECEVFNEFEKALDVYSRSAVIHDAIIIEPCTSDNKTFDIEKIERITATCATAKIIVSTSCGLPEKIIAAFDKKAAAYFIKPFNVEKIVDALKKIGAEKAETEKCLSDIKTNENWCRRFLDGIKEPVWIKDKSERLVMANKYFYEYFELDEKKVLGKSCEELKKLVDCVDIISSEPVCSPGFEKRILQMRKKNGEKPWFEHYLVNLLNEGKIAGVGSMLKNIDVQKNAYDRLQEKYSALFKPAPQNSENEKKCPAPVNNDRTQNESRPAGEKEKNDFTPANEGFADKKAADNFIKSYYSLFFKLNKSISENDAETIESLIFQTELLAKKASARTISELILKLLKPVKNKNKNQIDSILDEINFEFENYKSRVMQLCKN